MNFFVVINYNYMFFAESLICEKKKMSPMREKKMSLMREKVETHL